MKKSTFKALVAIGVMAACGTAAAAPTTYYLNQYGQRAGSGTRYTMIYDGSDGDVASAATWTWDSATGELSMSGFLNANQRIGSAPGPEGSWLLTDLVTDLYVNTDTGSLAGTDTDAATYECEEHGFGATTAASCYNTAVGLNVLIDSSVDYNVNGQAECQERTVGGDDAAGSGNVYRGLRSWNGTGAGVCGGANLDDDNTGRGALDVIHVLYDAGGNLVLANWNGTLTTQQAVQCVNAGTASVIDPVGFCGRAHWLVLSSTVPVPAAVWMFGSALGVLGAVRRRIKA